MDKRELTIEEVRALAEIERLMDAGKQPFVMSEGMRWAVQPIVMEELGLAQGQTVSRAIITAVLKAQCAALEAQIPMKQPAP